MDALRAEAKARWGHTDTWCQSEELTKVMGPADFRRANAEMATIMEAIVAAMPHGVASPAVQRRIGDYRAWLGRFAPVDDEVFRYWADMYVTTTASPRRSGSSTRTCRSSSATRCMSPWATARSVPDGSRPLMPR